MVLSYPFESKSCRLKKYTSSLTVSSMLSMCSRMWLNGAHTHTHD